MKMKIPMSEHLHVIRLILLAFPLMAVGTPLHAEVQPMRSEVSTTNAVQAVVENADLNRVSDYEKLAERLDKASEKAVSYYEKRYEELKATHNRFMGVVEVCLVVFTLFGGVLPIVATMMQHRNFDNAIGVAKEKIGVEFETKIKEAIFQAQIGSISAMEVVVAQAIERMAGHAMKTPEEQMHCVFNLATIMQTLHFIFEIAMRTHRANVIDDEIKKYRAFVSRWVEGDAPRPNIWHRAEALMKGSVSRVDGEATRRDYVELLGEKSDSFSWLKNFYARIAPWKFEEEK